MSINSFILLTLPAEVILHVFSYLDLPDLDSLSRLSAELTILAQDPVLHHNRIHVVAPSRIGHSLFANDGHLRPSVADLVHWGVLRGLGIERRWRMGHYFYSPQSVKQYEISQRLQRMQVKCILSTHLLKLQTAVIGRVISLRSQQVLPDVEYASPSISRSLLPVVRKLKWCIRRDELSKMVRARSFDGGSCKRKSLDWFEGSGHGLWKEHERVRLAICPGVRQFIRFFEGVAEECR